MNKGKTGNTLLKETVEVTFNGKKRRLTVIEAALAVNLAKALKGDDRAFRAVMNYIAKHPQEVEEPITVNIRRF